MVHVFDILSLEVGKYFFYPFGQQQSAFFLRISHYETVNVHKRYLGGFELFLIISQHIQKLNGINWQIHVNMIWALEFFGKGVMFFVNLSHCLPSTHVPADYFVLYLVNFSVELQIFIAVRVEIVGDDVQILFCRTNCHRTNSAEQVQQHFTRPHQLEQSVPLLLQSRTPVYFLEINSKLNSSFLKSGLVTQFSRHVFQGWCSVHIVKFLCFVDHCLNVGAFKECYFTNDYFPLFLFFGEVIMGDVSYSLEAAWESDVRGSIWISLFGEPIEYLLVIKIFIVEFQLCVSEFVFCEVESFLFDFDLCSIEQDHFAFSFGRDDSGYALQMHLVLGNFEGESFLSKDFIVSIDFCERQDQSWYFSGLFKVEDGIAYLFVGQLHYYTRKLYIISRNNAILQMKMLNLFQEILNMNVCGQVYIIQMSIEWNDLILLEQNKNDYQPSEEQIILYAEEIGLELPKDLKYLPIARQALMAPLPPFWEPCETADGALYYRNRKTRRISSENPLDQIYRLKVQEIKKMESNYGMEQINEESALNQSSGMYRSKLRVSDMRGSGRGGQNQMVQSNKFMKYHITEESVYSENGSVNEIDNWYNIKAKSKQKEPQWKINHFLEINKIIDSIDSYFPEKSHLITNIHTLPPDLSKLQKIMDLQQLDKLMKLRSQATQKRQKLQNLTKIRRQLQQSYDSLIL